MKSVVRLARPFVIAGLTIACVTVLCAQSTAILITDVTVIEGTDSPPRVATVLVNGNRIAAVGRRNQVRAPNGATIVDGRGKFLIPGLWDMHIHSGIDGYENGAKMLRRLVEYGVTGIRDMASPIDVIRRLRRESADGSILAPEIVAAGPILQRPLPFKLPPHVRTVIDADVTSVIDELKEQGVDFIKVGDTLNRDAYFKIAAESKRRGLSFAGHLPISVTALEAARAGQQSIEHFGSAGFRNVLIACSTAETELTREAQEALAGALAGGPSPDEKLYQAAFLTRLVNSYDARKSTMLFKAFVQNHTWQVPTLGAIRSAWDGRRAQLNAADAAASDLAAQKTLEMFADMRKAGVKILAGSDLPLSNPPPIHDELVALVQAGMTPLEALQAATRNPAEFLGRLTTEGTVEVGKTANLVLLDADPLKDIGNTRRVSAVVVRGTLIAGPDLQRDR